MFNAEQFLDMRIDEGNSTEVIPVPVGEYTAVIKEVKVKTWAKRDDPSITGVTLDVVWVLDSPEVAALLARKEVTVKQGVMLDLTESGSLDMGKGRNVSLGRLREAVGKNGPGFAFSQLPGLLAKVAVTHRVDGDRIFPEVRSVAKLG